MTREYRDSRKAFRPEVGRVYENQGGGTYRCLQAGGFLPARAAVMQNVASGWTLTAHDCGIYEDGRMDWDFSTDGRFEEVKR